MGKKLACVGVIVLAGVWLWAVWSGGVYLNNWSTAELVGSNAWTLVATAAGLYAIYWGLKKFIKGS